MDQPAAVRGHIARPRLVDVVAANAVVSLQAPAGYGKTTLMFEAARTLELELVRLIVPGGTDELSHLGAQLLRALGAVDLGLGPVERPDPELLAQVLLDRLADPSSPPSLVAVDEAHQLGPAGRRLVSGLIQGWRPPHRLLVGGRRLPSGLLCDGELDTPLLAFTDEEAIALFADLGLEVTAAELRVVNERLAGWPAAVAAVARRWRRAGTGSLTSLRPVDVVLEELVGDVLAEADPATVELAITAAHLPLLAEDIAAAIGGPEAWVRLIGLGLPLVDAGDCFVRLADPIGQHLRARGQPSPEALDAAARAYTAARAPAVALGLLVGAGRAEAAARLLAELAAVDLERLDAAELRALLAVLGPEVCRAEPRVWLQQARLAAVTGAIGDRTDLLATTRAAAVADGDAVLGRAVDAEAVRDLARQSRIAEALELGTQILPDCGPDELRTRAVCLSGLGLVEGTRPDGDRALAATQLQEAATLFRHLRAPAEEAGTLLWLGYWVQFAHGQTAAGVATVTNAVARLGRLDLRRGSVATFLAEMLARLGRDQDAAAALDDAYRIGLARDDTLTLVYASWVAAAIAAAAGDGARLVYHLAEAEARRGDWFDHSTGTDFLADAADFHRRLGRFEESRAYLDRAHGRAEGTLASRTFASAALDACAGDCGAAEEAAGQLAALAGSDRLFAIDRPRALLLAAEGWRRSGSAAKAAERLAAATTAAEALGLPDLLTRVEPLVAMAFAPARGAGAPASSRTIRLLGGLAVSVDGRPTNLAPGMGQLLVKRLALAGRPLTLDEILDALWPDADLSTSRRRLRNLLNRLREEGGHVIVRTPSGLALAPGFLVDADEFSAAARAALNEKGPEAEAAVVKALARYTGELLPEDRYDDWASLPRERLARQHLSLLDRLAELATERGDHLAAIDALDRAIAADPYEEARYLQAAEQALALGRNEQAAARLHRAESALAELGVTPSDQHNALRARVKAQDPRPVEG